MQCRDGTRATSCNSPYDPDAAPHVHEMESATGQFAQGLGVARQDRRPGVGLRIGDFVAILRVEVLHRISRAFLGMSERLSPNGRAWRALRRPSTSDAAVQHQAGDFEAMTGKRI